ncbi:MAG TPA: aminotransferase class V-fold PLP-dependent enzyme [Nocardioidaceae bacterium]|nr:aminotransferase class V-fold PLP-dependent enzyme [Nocardioidaceae bacterium]
MRYLDAVSTEPLHPAAREVLLSALDQGYADPLRLHGPGRNARLLLDNAREVTAECLGVRPDEVTFTSSGTAAVHAGLLGLALGAARTSRHLVHSAVEHSAVLHAARWWVSVHGGTTEAVPVDRLGRISALPQDAGVIAVQHGNPEVGTLQDVDPGGTPWFMDACATAGRIDLPQGWSAAAASAHKWGGPAGVGVLLVKKGARWRAPFPTDDRTDPRVAGFENVPAILAAAAALQALRAEDISATQHALTERIREAAGAIEDVDVVGDPDRRLPHVASFSALYVEGEALVMELDRLGFGVASGSACTASALEPSHVLAAMGALTHGNIRVSLTRTATSEDVDALLAVLPEVIGRLRHGI